MEKRKTKYIKFLADTSLLTAKNSNNNETKNGIFTCILLNILELKKKKNEKRSDLIVLNIHLKN